MTAITLRLPAAKNTPGQLTSAVFGVDTLTNLEAVQRTATFVVIMMIEGVLSAWTRPDTAAYMAGSLTLSKVTQDPDVDSQAQSRYVNRLAVINQQRVTLADNCKR